MSGKSYPAYLVPLPAALAAEVVCPDIQLFACSFCGHMQLSNTDPEVERLIYEVYYSHYIVDTNEALVPHYRVPFEEFLKNLDERKELPHGKLLEIGCSAGARASYFAQFSKLYVGIDPSERVKTAQKNNPDFKFINGYFPQALSSDDRFDVVVSQFNLEHITNIGEFVTGVHKISNENALLIIQVPDIGDFLRSSQPNFLAHEHVHYFTRSSLGDLLKLHGFEPIAWGNQGPSLIVAAKRVENFRGNLSQPNPNALVEARKQAQLFNDRPNIPNGPVVFYGVGPLLFWLLSSRQAGSKFHVVDDNSGYLNQSLPSYVVPIQKPSAALFESTPVVVLSLNKIYHERVLSKLRAFHVKMTVHYLGNEGWTAITL